MALQPILWASTWRRLGAIDSEPQEDTRNLFMNKKCNLTRVPYIHGQSGSYEELRNNYKCVRIADKRSTDDAEPIQLLRTYNSLPPVVFPLSQPAYMYFWKDVLQVVHHILRSLFPEYVTALTKRPKWSQNNGSLLKVSDVVFDHKDFNHVVFGFWEEWIGVPWKRWKHQSS